MLIPTIVMAVMAFIFFIIAYRKGGNAHIEGLQTTWDMTISIIPLLIFAFLVAGFVQVLLPSELVARWVGGESGIKGIFIGSVAGALTPGGPFVCFPIAAGLLKAGAGNGTMVAYITGWSVWAINRLPMEIGILGWKFTLIRALSTLILPPLAGLLAHVLFSGIKVTL